MWCIISCVCFHNNTVPEGHAFPHKSRDMRNIVYPHFTKFYKSDRNATQTEHHIMWYLIDIRNMDVIILPEIGDITN